MRVIGVSKVEDGHVVESGVVPVDHPQYDFLTEGCIVVWEYESQHTDPKKAWVDVMTKWHEFNGWEPYVPHPEWHREEDENDG